MKIVQLTLVAFLTSLAAQTAFGETKLKGGVRGVATRAPKEMKIDGDLSEFKNAFATPVEYFQPDNSGKKDLGLRDRAAQFFYMWDDEAFYAGLRTLDRNPFSSAPDDHLWEATRWNGISTRVRTKLFGVTTGRKRLTLERCI